MGYDDGYGDDDSMECVRCGVTLPSFMEGCPYCDDAIDEDDIDAATWPCPECAADIHVESQQCPVCGAYVTVRIKRSATRRRWEFWVVILMLTAIFMFWVMR